jgi:GntR family transcriptional regulator, histidine utilization repressor
MARVGLGTFLSRSLRVTTAVTLAGRFRVKARVAKPQAAKPAAISLGARIRRDIETRILAGDWAPGHRIPFEHELMVEYGCARMTVSKVLAALAESGLIERRRRAGSFVRRPQNQSAVLEIPDIKAEVLSRQQRYDYQLLSTRQRSMTRAEREQHAQGAAAANILALRCLHWADGAPYAFEERLILLAAVPEAARTDFALEPPGTWLLLHVPWHAAEHHISAQSANAELSRLLAIERHSACLVLDRRTWRSGQLLTAVRVWYPGTSQTLVARFTPASGGGR